MIVECSRYASTITKILDDGHPTPNAYINILQIEKAVPRFHETKETAHFNLNLH